MKTIIVQIGNTDDKLGQFDWAAYVRAVDVTINGSSQHVYFSGFSNPSSAWQNACWVFESPFNGILKKKLKKIAEEFHQDSIAWTEGQTEFIK